MSWLGLTGVFPRVAYALVSHSPHISKCPHRSTNLCFPLSGLDPKGDFYTLVVVIPKIWATEPSPLQTPKLAPPDFLNEETMIVCL